MKTRHRPTLSQRLSRASMREGVIVEQHIRAGRFQRSLSLITGLSGLLTGLEVSYEHYRGSYGQRIMYTPVILSFLLCIAGIWGALSRKAARVVLPFTSLIVILDGIIGFYYHIRGIHRKPGGWRIPIFNLVMGPPVFAPLLFSTIGFLGLVASFLRREDDPQYTWSSRRVQSRPAWSNWLLRRTPRAWENLEHDVREGRFQRVLAMVTALSTFFVWVESLYSHYKNNFAFRVQWTPVIMGPILIASSIGAVWSRMIARTLLPVASLLAIINGTVGFYYHVRGVIRRPGGLKKPVYNIIYGPPVLAPLIFAASGSMGLLTSLLRRAK